MSVVYSATAKTARMQSLVTSIGAGGKLKLFSAADALLATFTLAATAGTVSGSVLTLSDANGGTAGILNTTASAAGTATKASITTSADADVVTNALTVGTAAADVIIDNPTFTAGQAITVNTFTLTHV